MNDTGASDKNVSPKRVEVAIAIVFDRAGQNAGRLLICKRKAESVLGGYWEFPGGKCLPDEPPALCAVRETGEETGLRVQVIRQLPPIEHQYPHAHIRLTPFICERIGGVLQLLQVAEARWISPSDISNYRFPEANADLVAQISCGHHDLSIELPSPTAVVHQD